MEIYSLLSLSIDLAALVVECVMLYLAFRSYTDNKKP